MGHLIYLMFRCDFNVMESLEILEELGELNTVQQTILALGTRHEKIAIFALGRNDRCLALIVRRAHLQAAAPAVGRP